MIDIFISHSSKDKQLAESVVQLLRDTIILDGSEIRCTSSYVGGLSIGSKFTKQLRKDIQESEVVLAIISSNSIKSQFFLFELGAAWGLKIPIIPLLTTNFNSSLIQRPLSDLNYLVWNSETDWHKLLKQVAKLIDCKLENRVIVHAKVQEFCKDN
jgi:hypothetical protein